MLKRLSKSPLPTALALAGIAVAQAPALSPAIPLVQTLQQYLKGPFGAEYRPTRIQTALANLAPPSPQILVYVTGPHWCGSGGCTLLVVAKAGSSYQVICQTIGVELPVRILPSVTAGWHDLGVGSREGPKLLAFNGRKYPINAYSFPSRGLSAGPTGQMAIPPAAKAVPLYH